MYEELLSFKSLGTQPGLNDDTAALIPGCGEETYADNKFHTKRTKLNHEFLEYGANLYTHNQKIREFAVLLTIRIVV